MDISVLLWQCLNAVSHLSPVFPVYLQQLPPHSLSLSEIMDAGRNKSAQQPRSSEKPYIPRFRLQFRSLVTIHYLPCCFTIIYIYSLLRFECQRMWINALPTMHRKLAVINSCCKRIFRDGFTWWYSLKEKLDAWLAVQTAPMLCLNFITPL